MKYLKIVLVLLAISALTIAAVKFSPRNENDGATQNIVIGTIFSQTGIASAFGEMTYKGVMMAVDEINENGGIDGKKVVVVSEDDRTDGKTTVGAYKKLTSIDNVDAIIGGNFDFTTSQLFDTAKEGDTVVVSPMNSRISGSLETNEKSFTMLIDFSDIVRYLDSYLNTTEYNKLAVVHYASGFGNEIVKTLGEISTKNGRGAAVDEVYTDFGTTDWKPYILRLKKQGVDMVFADMLQDDFVRFVSEANKLGFKAKLMTHNDVRNALSRKDVNLSILDGVIVLNWDVLGSESFVAKFKEKYGTAPINHASQAYVTTYIVAEALAKNGKAGLAKYLESNTFATPEGDYSFDKNHAATYTPIKVQKIMGGKLVDL